MKYPKNIPVKGRVRVCLEFLKDQNLKGKALLDVGSSFGWLAKSIEDEKLKKYIGIDPNEHAISYAKKNVGWATFKVGFAGELPVKNFSVDLVSMFDVIEHVPVGTEQEVFKEVNRVLKKNGRFLLSTPNNHWLMNILDPAWYFGHRHYIPKNLEKMLQKAGFRIEKLEVRGGLWFSIYLIWLYFTKRLTGNSVPRNSFLEKMDDKQFNKKGIHTIYLVAQKVSSL